jgi:hypothetical protein
MENRYFLAGLIVFGAVGYIVIEKLNKLIKLAIMSNAALEAAKAKVGEIETRLTNIEEDISRIKENLPSEGGLTEAEVAELNTTLDNVIAKAKGLDEANEPEETEPTEPIA